MESKVKFMGHPLHPILIVLPLGLFAIAVVFDILYIITQHTGFAQAAFYAIAAGVLSGLLAAVFGYLDWREVPASTRARRIGLLHGVGNVVIVVLFATSWLIRASDPLHLPSALAFILALIAVALAVVTGWLGGEMVYRLGVGADRGANLNAPSSLSGSPADINPHR